MPIVTVEVLYPFVWKGDVLAPRMRILLEDPAEAERLTALGAVRPVAADPPPATPPATTEPPAPAAEPAPAASEPEAVGRRVRRH